MAIEVTCKKCNGKAELIGATETVLRVDILKCPRCGSYSPWTGDDGPLRAMDDYWDSKNKGFFRRLLGR